MKRFGLAFMICVSTSLPAFSADKWTNAAGSKSIDGDFVKLDGIKLTIRKEDGTESTIPLYLLDDASRLRARALAKGDKTGALAAGMTNASLKSVEVMSLSDVEAKFASLKTAEEYFQFLSEEAAKGNYVIGWDAFPPSLQAEMENIYRAAISKLEQPALSDLLKLKTTIVGTLKSKKSYLLNSRELPIPVEAKPVVELLYDPVVELVDAALPESFFKAETLRSTEPRDLATTLVLSIAPRLDGIVNYLPPGTNPFDSMTSLGESAKFKQVSSTEAEMTTVGITGQDVTQTLIRVENRWVPAEMLDDLKPGFAESLASLQQVDPKEFTRSVRQGLLPLIALLGSLANAESQQDVDDILKLLLGSLPPAMGGVSIPGFGPP
ncbi:hypothetical protein SH449x_003369 [Pirellulaceae bacterium SH449]